MANTDKYKTVLITGASEGIGYEFAKTFAENNYNILAISKNTEKLCELKSELENKYCITVNILSIDLSHLSNLNEIYQFIKNNNIKIDILINNAGFGIFGDFTETDFQRELDMINVNIVSLTYLTKIILKEMVRNKSGTIINVASTASFKPGPLMSVYYATKAYVLSFSEAVAAEIKNSGVNIIILCPGPTGTDFFMKASGRKLSVSKYNKIATPYEVAMFGFNAIKKNKLIAIPGFRNRIYTKILKFIPGRLITYILYRLKKKT